MSDLETGGVVSNAFPKHHPCILKENRRFCARFLNFSGAFYGGDLMGICVSHSDFDSII